MTRYQIICLDDDDRFLQSMEQSLPQRVSRLCPLFDCEFEFVASPAELDSVLKSSSPEGETPGGEPTFAMLISDQMMPGCTGIEVIERVKAANPYSVCILLTGHAGLESAKYAINRHLLDQYVSKPIEDLEVFTSLVANLLKRHHADAQERQLTAQLAHTVEALRKSNEQVKNMHSAAEQVAMLSKGLRSLDLDDVVNLVSREVPRLFDAQWGLLCLPQGPCPHQGSANALHRQQCQCPSDLVPTLASGSEKDAIGPLPSNCQLAGGQAPRMTIPLTLQASTASATQTPNGYLCLCHLAKPQEQELLLYKASLLQDVISANLSNAMLYDQVRRTSEQDTLTGAYTRRVFEQKLEAEFDRATRYGCPFCVAIIDVDRFKQVNDSLGHLAGDALLGKLAQAVRAEARATDVFARYGGDEFALIMPQTSHEDALVLIDRVRQGVEKVAMAERLTISCGVSEYNAQLDDNASSLLRRADAALYQAKHDGRNRTQLAA